MNVELERIDKIATEPNYDNIIPIKKYKVPYYDMPVSAGTGNPLDEEYPEKVDLVEQPPKGTDFIVRVSGDKMCIRDRMCLVYDDCIEIIALELI